MIKMDEIDSRILRVLINDARSKLTNIAKDCKISSTAIKNRIERMKNDGIIVNAALSFNMASFGYPYPALIGVNVDFNEQHKIIELIKEHAKIAAIDQTIGKYDLCLFVFAQSINKLDELKILVRRQKGVEQVDVNIWKKFYLNYSNIKI